MKEDLYFNARSCLVQPVYRTWNFNCCRQTDDFQRQGTPGTAFQRFGQIIQPVNAHQLGINDLINFLLVLGWPGTTLKFNAKGKANTGFKILDQTAHSVL